MKTASVTISLENDGNKQKVKDRVKTKGISLKGEDIFRLEKMNMRDRKKALCQEKLKIVLITKNQFHVLRILLFRS